MWYKCDRQKAHLAVSGLLSLFPIAMLIINGLADSKRGQNADPTISEGSWNPDLVL